MGSRKSRSAGGSARSDIFPSGPPPARPSPPPPPSPSIVSSPDDHDTRSIVSRRAAPPSTLPPPSDQSEEEAMARPKFTIPKLWQTAMMLVSINSNLHPQTIAHKYEEQLPFQAEAHPGYVELDLTRTRAASIRDVRTVQIHYADDDPAAIFLLAIFVSPADGLPGPVPMSPMGPMGPGPMGPGGPPGMMMMGGVPGPGGGGGHGSPGARPPPSPRIVTNTSIRHVLVEPCANCPLWLRVHVDLQPGPGMAPYYLIPCCDEWAESADFELPMSPEEKAIPGVVDRMVRQLKDKSELLQAREKELEALRSAKGLPPGGQGDNGSGKGVQPVPAAGAGAGAEVHAQGESSQDIISQYRYALVASYVILLVALILK